MPEIAVEIETVMARNRQRWRLLLLLAIVAGGLLWGGWKWWELRRYRRAMAEIKAEIESGRTGTAALRLNAILAGKTDSDEAAYLLGTCEKARGRTQAASRAWGQVPSGSPFESRAIQGRMGLEIDRGRLAVAEQLIKQGAARSSGGRFRIAEAARPHILPGRPPRGSAMFD